MPKFRSSENGATSSNRRGLVVTGRGVEKDFVPLPLIVGPNLLAEASTRLTLDAICIAVHKLIQGTGSIEI